MNGHPLNAELIEILIVALLVGGSLLYVARNALTGIRNASRAKASGCSGCNACGSCPTERE
ncbi:MAG: hypothetical protein ACOY9J_00575 [Pseudomonadota bacterium]